MFFWVRKATSSTPLHVAALASIAVSQPLLDVLGKAPDFLLAHDLGPADILAVIFIVGGVVPALAAAIAAALDRLHPPSGRAAATVIVWLCSSLIVLFAMRGWTIAPWVVVGLAVAAGMLATISYRRMPAVRTFAGWLIPGIVVFPLVFLLRPATQRLLWPPETQVAAAASADTPVVMIVFDGLPLTALLDENRQIDRRAYPSFAELAEQSTWYRNATTVSDYTRWAVPAIISGRYPVASALPIAADHPETIFTLLGSSHDVKIHEPISRLCPESVCDHEPRSLAVEVARFLPTLSLSYLLTVLPDSLENHLPPLDQGWAEGVPPSDTPGEVWLKAGDQSRSGQAVAFINSIEPGESEPSFHFLHVLLPHTPLAYLPHGERYGTERQLQGLQEGRRDRWLRDEWAVTQGYRRFLLQVAYVDTLLGELVNRLKIAGLYDRAVIVVTADHGASFKAGEPFRRATSQTYMDVLPVPLLIKAPYQKTGAVSDRNVETIDILPTIAQMLDIRLPWRVDGTSILDANPPRSIKTVYVEDARRTMKFGASVLGEAYASVDRKLRLFGGADKNYYRIPLTSPFGDLIGKNVDDLRVSDQADGLQFAIDVHGDFASVDPASRFIPAHLAGRARWKNGRDPASLAFSVNGTIRATTRTYQFNPRQVGDMWSVVLPPDAFLRGKNDVEVFVVGPGDRANPVLHRAHFSEERPLDLTSNAAAYGLGVTYDGLDARKGTGDGSARWTNGHAQIVVPMAGRRRPRSLRVYLGNSGPEGTPLKILVNECELFDGTTARDARWSAILSFSGCPIEDTATTIELISENPVPVERVEFLDYGWPPGPAKLPDAGRRSQITLENAHGDGPTVAADSTVAVRVVNRGTSVWATARDLKQEEGSVRVGALWLRPGGKGPALGVQRFDLPRPLIPGDSTDLSFQLTPMAVDGSRLPAGEYEVWIGFLQEGVSWFYTSGDSVRKLRVIHDARP